MRKANEAIKRTKHVMPTINELITDLNGASVFSVLDLRSAYHQLELQPESRYITTFSTHVGLFRYKRLMFGINAASEVFQNALSGVLSGLKGCKNMSDDIIVYGQTQESHDKNLKAVLERLEQANLKLNKDKCRFGQKQVTFYGHIFSSDGIAADRRKISGAQWEWTCVHQKALDDLKHKLTSVCTEEYFDPTKRSEVVVDARKDDENPADYMSRHPDQPAATYAAEDYINYMCTNTVPKALTVRDVEEHALRDPVLQRLIRAIGHGHWADEELVPYLTVKDEPWKEVAVDFAGPFPTGEYLLAVVDEYSRFPEVELVTSTSSKATIPKLDSIFARQGIPDTVKTDNGPPFNGTEFSSFAEVGISSSTYSPLLPEENGEAKRFMRTL
ncbi:PREDICTED: uncharacterized protein K02A2.6-like [Priapulus caudatus]|uniref:Uncharacterized protein K02A2.6-like n=1 Tax=Priapulus caudatus TaxID=37621 RepID=A0ABM1E0X9_PRICU|nr:PREDICTED: uncharacterized protein K02A2.6-like [Priapulus caudatus]